MRTSALVLPLLLILVGRLNNDTVGRIGVESLQRRLSVFYNDHATAEEPVPTDAKLARLASKFYGREDEMDKTLRSKYGEPLPPEDIAHLVSLLALDDAPARGLYVVRRVGARAASAALEAMGVGQVGVNSDGFAQHLRAKKVSAQLAIIAVGVSTIQLILPMGPGLRGAILASAALAVAVEVRPKPEEVEPAALLADLGAAWDDTSAVVPRSDEWWQIVGGRLALIGGTANVALSLSGRRSAPTLLLAAFIATAVATKPALTVPHTELGFIEPKSRAKFAKAIRGREADALRTIDLGVFSMVTLQVGGMGAGEPEPWQAAVVSVGAFGSWRPATTLRAESGKFSVSGLPAWSVVTMTLLAPLTILYTAPDAPSSQLSVLARLASRTLVVGALPLVYQLLTE